MDVDRPDGAQTQARRGFQRARRPAEKEQRRNAILAAAAELVDEHGADSLSLSQLARHCGLTKSNIYRYFESREDVLLRLFLDDLRELLDALMPRLRRCARGDYEALARATASAYLARPRLCRLLGMIAPILEQNVSEEVVAAAKLEALELSLPYAQALQDRLPPLSLDDAVWAVHMVALLVGGVFPSACPGPSAQAVLAQPQFAAFRVDPQRDLTRAIAALLRGLVAERGS